MRQKTWFFKTGISAALATLALVFILLVTACPLGSNNTYTVSFSSGEGGSTAPANQTVEKGTSIILPNQGGMTAPTEKTFEGWKTGDKTYKAGDSFTVNADTEFAAQWKSNDAKDDDDTNDNATNGISWTSEPNGTLTVGNNVVKDMVIFQGQTPSASNILGGVRASSSREFDVSDDVTDFDVGGYLILRGISLDEYEAHKTNLSLAKVEYSAMATYGKGQKYRVEISPNYTGDFGYKVTNSGRIGLELRKNSPDGEKIAYLPSLASNVMLYAGAATSLSIFPVYVYYSKTTGKVTTLKPTDHFASVTATPRPLAQATSIQSYYFPNDETTTWDTIKASLKSPVAYFTVANNVPNQGLFFTLAGGNALYAQNGYDAVGAGEQLTFELESTVQGVGKYIVITLYNGSLKLPVRFADETDNPVIKNGYDYTVTVNFKGGQVSDTANYTVTLTEGQERDLTTEIESL